MATYVLYLLDEAGKISRSDPIEAESDEAALSHAHALKLPIECELWLHERRVGRIAPFARNDAKKPI